MGEITSISFILNRKKTGHLNTVNKIDTVITAQAIEEYKDTEFGSKIVLKI